jgi:hypothetical protein
LDWPDVSDRFVAERNICHEIAFPAYQDRLTQEAPMAKPVQESWPECTPAAENEVDELDSACNAVETQPNAVAYPIIAEKAEWSEVITHYDRQHFLTYARLLTAEREEIDWRDGVREILRQDPDKDPRQARICWESHLERARWIASEGVLQAVARAYAQ